MLCRLYPRWEPGAGKPHVRIWCSEASCHSSGWKSRQQRSPVTVVVIPSSGEGDRSAGSLEVKAPGGRSYRSDPYKGASNLVGRSKCVNREAPKDVPRAKRIAGGLGVPSRSDLGEGDVGIDVLDQTMIELPGVIESGMPRRNGQRKPGTTRGSPRRSRTAKALRISRHAVKSQCAHGWGGWGRLSDDGPRNSITWIRARAPGAEDYPTSMAAHDRAADPTQRGPIKPPRGARKADTNRTSDHECREQA